TELATAFHRLTDGFDPATARTYTFQTTITGSRWAKSPQDQQFYERLLTGMRAMPQVESAGVTTSLMNVGDASGTLVTVAGGERLPPDRQPMAAYTMADAAFFPLAGLPWREGRLFEAGDRANTPPVAVVNESFVRLVSPDQPMLGRRVRV